MNQDEYFVRRPAVATEAPPTGATSVVVPEPQSSSWSLADAPKPTGLSFKIFGIPVGLNASFLLIGLVLLFGSGRSWVTVVGFVAMITVSVLWHELGHAAAFKCFGHEPGIRLLGFFGLTYSRTKKTITDGQMLVIAAAGPVAGLLLAGACFVLASAISPMGTGTWLTKYWLTQLMVINLIINIANLLPALPLDGGRIMKSLMSMAAPTWGEKIAHGVSVVVAAGALWYAMTNGYELSALLLLGIVGMNFTALRSGSAPQPQAA